MQTTDHTEEFWSNIYRGRTIAIYNYHGCWLTYLDHALQPRMIFASAEAAVAWLRRQVDAPAPRLR
jgi:hypothetical protein